MLIVFASNFDLNIPECHIRDSLLSLCNHFHNYFDTLGAQYHDMILYHCINILPYRYVSKTLLVCVQYMCLCVFVCVCARVCVHTVCLYMYAYVS